MDKTVLILEDEADIRAFVVINLKRAGFEVLEASYGKEALDIIDGHQNIQVAILDIMLPDMNGFEVCQKIREKNKAIGIIMLTAKSQEMDKITGLTMGADDYVIKPFSPAELVARIDALCRRIHVEQKETEDKLISEPFTIDLASRKVYKQEMVIDLTQTEYELMELFLKNKNKAFSRNELLDAVWGENYFGNEKVVDVNIRRLRQKIEKDPSTPQYIETLWGYGYRWKEGE